MRFKLKITPLISPLYLVRAVADVIPSDETDMAMDLLMDTYDYDVHPINILELDVLPDNLKRLDCFNDSIYFTGRIPHRISNRFIAENPSSTTSKLLDKIDTKDVTGVFLLRNCFSEEDVPDWAATTNITDICPSYPERSIEQDKPQTYGREASNNKIKARIAMERLIRMKDNSWYPVARKAAIASYRSVISFHQKSEQLGEKKEKENEIVDNTP